MDAMLFVQLLAGFSALSSLTTQAAKQLMGEDAMSPNLLALIIGVIEGCVGTLIYYQLSAVAFTVNNIISAVLMGFFVALVSQVGFDKVKETIASFGMK